jgi:asparagine synthase (glutamine-hydrolysing)
MCGIAGVARVHGGVTADTLQAMAQRLSHRGPDDAGIHIHRWAGLAHTRLSIIDLSTGHQPLFDKEGTIALIANGEIYNHVELRQALESQGHRFLTQSDSEVILHAYREYGDGCLEHLDGMFAFALLDTRRDRMLIARDRLGIKPLFIAELPDGLAFASEIKALLPVLPHAPQVRPDALAQFLQVSFATGRHTLVQGVERLLPGEALSIDGKGATRRWRWWSPYSVAPWTGSLDEASEHFSGLMDEVMTRHLRSDVPWSLFLSGGVDSSTLAALLSRKEHPPQAWTVGFDSDSVHNEVPAAQTVARACNIPLQTLSINPHTLFRRLPHCLWAADELMGDYANLPVSILAEQASHTHKVVFSGEGGDEVFAGYGRYRIPALKRLVYQLQAPGTGGFRTRGQFSRYDRRGLLSAPLEAANRNWRKPYIEAWKSSPAGFSRLQRMQAADMTTWLPDDLLVKADRMLMAWGVEGRVPFLDHRVVQFGLSLPDHFKVRGRTGKVFLREWSTCVLPAELLRGRKRGFTVPVSEWLSGPTLDLLRQRLPCSRGIRQWFQPEAVTALIDRRRRGDPDATAPVGALTQFALWHRLWIEGDGAAPPVDLDPVEMLGAPQD